MHPGRPCGRSRARRRDVPVWQTSARRARCHARPGERVALVGPSGAGKTTASLPEGAETFVGEEGAELSGGQRQRVVLARALLSDAPVLVLDGPTANVDPETAEELVRDVLEEADGRSVLPITHRPEGLDLMDRVVALDDVARVRPSS